MRFAAALMAAFFAVNLSVEDAHAKKLLRVTIQNL